MIQDLRYDLPGDTALCRGDRRRSRRRRPQCDRPQGGKPRARIRHHRADALHEPRRLGQGGLGRFAAVHLAGGKPPARRGDAAGDRADPASGRRSSPADRCRTDSGPTRSSGRRAWTRSPAVNAVTCGCSNCGSSAATLIRRHLPVCAVESGQAEVGDRRHRRGVSPPSAGTAVAARVQGSCPTVFPVERR